MSGKHHANTGERALALLIQAMAWLPLPLLYLIADALFVVLYYLFRAERKLVNGNLQRAFPDMPGPERKRLAAKTCRNALHVLFETIHAIRIPENELRRRVQFENLELVNQLLDRHGKILVVAAHQGNWEWLNLASSLCLPVPLATLYKPLSHPALEALLNRARERFGGQMIPAQATSSRLIRFTRKRSVVAVVADQGPQPQEEKIWATFLNQDTAFYPGIEKLARVLEMPVLFAHVTRVKRGHYRVRVETLCEPPYSSPNGEVMARYVHAVEQQILDYPEDWLWVYKRWKYRKPETVSP